jgi:hypothetical protein
VELNNDAGEMTIDLDGQTGDIALAQADCAEQFDIANVEHAEPGTVLVLGEGGILVRSTEAYDRRVAGVISGAADGKLAIVPGKEPSQRERVSVALIGKVHWFLFSG